MFKKGHTPWNKNIPHTEKSKRKMAEATKRAAERGCYTVHPNKPETVLINLLNILLPNEYKYVGDFKFWIEFLNPDFININGQKKIIELFGDYWHRDTQKEDKKRIKTYQKYGYNTLVIWERELKDIDKVKNRIMEFHNV